LPVGMPCERVITQSPDFFAGAKRNELVLDVAMEQIVGGFNALEAC